LIPWRSVFAAAATLSFGYVPSAMAGSTNVVIVLPASPTEATERAIHRLESELKSAGFSVQRGDRSESTTRGHELGCAGPDPAFSFVEEGAELWALLCIRDRTTDKPTVWRVGIRSDARSDPEAALAIRAVEVLRANLVTGDSLAQAPTAIPPQPAPTPDEISPSPRRETSLLAGAFGELGVGALRGWPSLGPTITPVLRIGYGSADGWAGRITFVALGSHARLQSSAGSAEVTHQAAVVELVHAFVVTKWVQPHVAVGAGFYHADVVGSAPAGYEAYSGSMLALLTDVDAGVAVRLADRLAITMGFSGFISFPGLKVRLGDEQAGGSGRPLLLASLGLSASYGP
jgi:hypothetical protein